MTTSPLWKLLAYSYLYQLLRKLTLIIVGSNASVSENILFGLPMKLERYHNVLHACALTKDLAGFAEGDRTEIGPKGVNLSGPLVKDRTLILATHHLSLCAPYVNYVISLASNRKGQVIGTVTKLDCSDSIDTSYGEEEIQEEIRARLRETCIAARDADTMSISSSTLPPSPTTPLVTRKYVEDEEQRTVGSNHWLLLHYLRQVGSVWHSVLIVLTYVGYVGFVIGKSWWIAHWAHQNASTSDEVTALVKRDNFSWYLGIYTAVSVLACVAGSLRYYLTLSSALCATRKLFESLLHSVLHAKLDFLDRSLPGRLLNRFSSDIAVLDNQVGKALGDAFVSALELLAILLVGTMTSWWILLISIAMLIRCGQGAYQFYGAARTWNTSIASLGVQFWNDLARLSGCRQSALLGSRKATTTCSTLKSIATLAPSGISGLSTPGSATVCDGGHFRTLVEETG